MQRKTILSQAILSACLVLGASQVYAADAAPAQEKPAAAPVTPDKNEMVAKINDKTITQADLAEYEKIRGKQAGGNVHPDKQTLVDEMVDRELLFQDAIKKGLDKTPDFAKEMDTLRFNVLAKAAMQDYLKSTPATDEQLKAHYDKVIAKVNFPMEYKARHILVEKEEDAKAIIADLNQGKVFADIAKEKSKDPGSAKEGGDLGWFRAEQMVKEFSEAAAKLEKGKYTVEPVKSQFGFHIIMLEDSRKMQPPAFDAVKEKVKGSYQNEQMMNYATDLKKNAKIDIKLPAEPVKEPAKDAAPADAPKPTEQKPAEQPKK
jgi:peptidyl-prolyl cis-trans isomerase C